MEKTTSKRALRTASVSKGVAMGFTEELTARYSTSRLRSALEIVNGILSLAMVTLYVVTTYVGTIGDGVKYVYLAASCTFSVELLFRTLLSKDALRSLLTTWYNYIDVLTIVYGFIYFFDGNEASDLAIIGVLRMFQVVRMLNMLIDLFFMLRGSGISAMQVEFYKAGFDLATTLITCLFVSGCVLFELEANNGRSGSPTYLHQSLYWACVTFSTIGYGDFYPNTLAGYLIFPIMVLVILIILPAKISVFTSLLAIFNQWMRFEYRPWKFGRHIVLLGDFNHGSVMTFCNEFFHPDRHTVQFDIVLMDPEPPSPELLLGLSLNGQPDHIKILQGSPFNAPDLKRAGADQAMAIFIMSNKYSAEPQSEDADTMLTVLAISQFLRQYAGSNIGDNPQVYHWNSASWRARMDKRVSLGALEPSLTPKIVVQFNLAENIEHAEELLASQAMFAPEIGLLPAASPIMPMDMLGLKHALVGAALRCPGLLTLIANLSISTHIDDALFTDEHAKEQLGWLYEYLMGCEQELYQIQFPCEYYGQTFFETAEELYVSFGAVLIALCSDGQAPPSYSGEVVSPNLELAPFREDGQIAQSTIGYILAANNVSAESLSNARRGKSGRVSFSPVRIGVDRIVPAQARSDSTTGLLSPAPREQAALASSPVASPENSQFASTAKRAATSSSPSSSPARGNSSGGGSGAAPKPASSLKTLPPKRLSPSGAPPPKSLTPLTGTTSAGLPGALPSPTATSPRTSTAQPPAAAATASSPAATAGTAAAMPPVPSKTVAAPPPLPPPGAPPAPPPAPPPDTATAAAQPSSSSLRASLPTAASSANTSASKLASASPRTSLSPISHNTQPPASPANRLGGGGSPQGNRTTSGRGEERQGSFRRGADAVAAAALAPATGIAKVTSLTPMPALVLVVGSSCFHSLPTLISSVRAGRVLADVPVVIMDQEGPSDLHLATLAGFKDVTVLHGSPPRQEQSMAQLHLPAGCRVSAVIMPNRHETDADGALGKAAARGDAETICIIKNLREYCQRRAAHLKIITEVLGMVNIAYALPICLEAPADLTDSLILHHQRLKSQPSLPLQHASSEGSTVALVQRHDAVAVGAARELAGGALDVLATLRDNKLELFLSRLFGSMPHLSPILATGNILKADFMDSMFCQSLFNPMMFQLVLKLLGSSPPQGAQAPPADDDAHILSVPLPDLLAKRRGLLDKLGDGVDVLDDRQALTYGELFMDCLQRQQVALGLYRQDVLSGYPYTHTNPLKSTRLRLTDRVFVLSTLGRLGGGG